MRRILVDTNVLVSFLTDRNRRQQERAAALLESAAGGNLELLVHHFVVFELAYVLLNLYGKRPADVRQILEALTLLPGVSLIDELSWSEVLRIWPEAFPDLADAALAAASRDVRADGIATFDKKFIRQLKRVGLQSVW